MNLAATVNARKHVKSGLFVFGLLLVFLAVACGASVTASTEDRDVSFSVGDSPKVVVNGSNGRINVNAGTGDTVRVQATLKRPEDLEYEVTQDGDTIRVDVEEKGSGINFFGQSPGADIEITAPSNTSVELRTSNGMIELFGMHRSGTVRSSNGKIVMADVVGDFDVTTSNGAVSIARASGTFNVETSNGRIDFAGDIVPGGSNRMTTSNGSVEITLNGSPSVELDASTSNGSITTRLPILTTTIDDKHHIVGKIGAGDAELYVRTANGSVTLQ
ncbi:MAG: DUF4097 family beta strand repeat-containing protein [SAR202 cluster bacterium]|nr:DUF4097 family beta strand repeat-containing protein [SAR202 cluster bacterium]MDP6714057.1 DUF4097 family beta strand repeat-containing protein [SAR202 cluster bacterium]